MSMKLYRKMMVERCVIAPDRHFRPEAQRCIDSLVALRDQLVCIDCTDAVNMIVEKELSSDDFCCNQVPPAPKFWLEWRREPQPGEYLQQGAIVVTNTKEDIHDFWAISAYSLPRLPGTLVGDYLCAWRSERTTGKLLPLDESGSLFANGASDTQDDEQFMYWFGVIPAIIWFMQIRNIVQSNLPVSSKEQKQLRSHGVRKIDFRTLKISHEIIRNANAQQTGGHRDFPLHMVIGHFKRYTDKPLLGKHIGTFFFPAHFRGDKKNGEIRKDYQL